MINNTEKTIPYRLSQAELENLKVLRRRTKPSRSIWNDEEEKIISEELDAWNSDPDRLNQKPERKIP